MNYHFQPQITDTFQSKNPQNFSEPHTRLINLGAIPGNQGQDNNIQNLQQISDQLPSFGAGQQHDICQTKTHIDVRRENTNIDPQGQIPLPQVVQNSTFRQKEFSIPLQNQQGVTLTGNYELQQNSDLRKLNTDVSQNMKTISSNQIQTQPKFDKIIVDNSISTHVYNNQPWQVHQTKEVYNQTTENNEPKRAAQDQNQQSSTQMLQKEKDSSPMQDDNFVEHSNTQFDGLEFLLKNHSNQEESEGTNSFSLNQNYCDSENMMQRQISMANPDQFLPGNDRAIVSELDQISSEEPKKQQFQYEQAGTAQNNVQGAQEKLQNNFDSGLFQKGKDSQNQIRQDSSMKLAEFNNKDSVTQNQNLPIINMNYQQQNDLNISGLLYREDVQAREPQITTSGSKNQPTFYQQQEDSMKEWYPPLQNSQQFKFKEFQQKEQGNNYDSNTLISNLIPSMPNFQLFATGIKNLQPQTEQVSTVTPQPIIETQQPQVQAELNIEQPAQQNSQKLDHSDKQLPLQQETLKQSPSNFRQTQQVETSGNHQPTISIKLQQSGNTPRDHQATIQQSGNQDSQTIQHKEVDQSGGTQQAKQENLFWEQMYHKLMVGQKGLKSPLSPYIFYSQECRKELKKSNPELLSKQIMKILSKQWKLKPDEEKKKYVYFAQLDKLRFEDDKKIKRQKLKSQAQQSQDPHHPITTQDKIQDLETQATSDKMHISPPLIPITKQKEPLLAKRPVNVRGKQRIDYIQFIKPKASNFNHHATPTSQQDKDETSSRPSLDKELQREIKLPKKRTSKKTLLMQKDESKQRADKNRTKNNNNEDQKSKVGIQNIHHQILQSTQAQTGQETYQDVQRCVIAKKRGRGRPPKSSYIIHHHDDKQQ